MTDDESRRLAERGTRNSEAYNAFMLGRYHLDRWPSPDAKTSLSAAIPYFEKAIEEDPLFQEPYYTLGNTYFIFGRNYYDHSSDDFRKAKEYWQKLVEVDDSTALAHHTKARILWQYDRNWKEADREYKRALALEPVPTTIITYYPTSIPYYEWFLEWVGHREEYTSYLESQLRRADPLSPTTQGGIAWNLLWAREYDRAIEHAKKSLKLEPQWFDPWVIISLSYEVQGEETEAFNAELEALRNGGADDERIRAAQEAYDESGIKGVRRLGPYHHGEKSNPRPINIATAFVRQGDKDMAFKWLKKSWADPLWGGENAPSNPFLDPLRDDPRFEQLLRELSLPEEAIQKHLRCPSS